MRSRGPFGLNKSKWQAVRHLPEAVRHLVRERAACNDEPPPLAPAQHAAEWSRSARSSRSSSRTVLHEGTSTTSRVRGTRTKSVLVATALGFYAMPAGGFGIMLIIIFAGVIPTGGRQNEFLLNPPLLDARRRTCWRTWCCPALTLGLVLYGEYTLIVRSAMLETLGEDYVLTARAKGLKPRTIVRKHALRNAMLPITTLDRTLPRLHRRRRHPDRDGLLVAGHRPRGL